MKEFDKQLEQNLQYNIFEFNTKQEYSKIRDLYKNKFSIIETLINKFGYRHSIEEISQLDGNLTRLILDNSLLLKEINRAICIGVLKLNDLK